MFVRSASLRSRSAGFTLVELMVVVAVIGVGGGLALFNMSEQVADARAKADGHAMMERIRLEHRTAKERMTGLTLKQVDNDLVFTPAKNCKPIVDPISGLSAVTAVRFLETTKLIIAGSTLYCWDEQGRPRPENLPSDGGGGGGLTLKGFADSYAPDSLAPEAASILPKMGIFTGKSSAPELGWLMPVKVTQIGVSAEDSKVTSLAGAVSDVSISIYEPESLGL